MIIQDNQMYKAIKDCLIEEREYEFLGTLRAATLRLNWNMNQFLNECRKTLDWLLTHHTE